MERSGFIAPNSTFTLTFQADQPATRLDTFLTASFPGYSRSYFQKLIEQNVVSVNDTHPKPSILLKAGDVIVITFPPEMTVTARDIATDHIGIEIVFEHEQFVVINKPPYVVTHPTTLTDNQPSVVDWLIKQYPSITNVGSSERPGIVHRLDKDTSGLMIIARTLYAHAQFGTMFKDRAMQKTYWAIVQGHPPASGSIDFSIGRDPITRNKMAAFATGQSIPALTPKTTHAAGAIRPALTNYKVLQYFEDAALLELKPVTGRTHQIRVHCAALGYPLLGDELYGNSSKLIKRHALHARTIAFEFDGIPYSFTQELPDDMKKVIQLLRPIS